MARAANKANHEEPIDERGRRRDAAERARRLAKKQADAMPVVGPVDRPRKVRVVDAPLEDPAPRGGLLELASMRYLLRLIVGRELAKQYAASVLGLIWSYIQPAMRFSVYYFIFGYIIMRGQGVPNFAIHLFCGMVFVSYFTETWNGGTRSIWGNRNLVMKMRVPREIFPVASVIVAAYHTLPQLVLLSIICLILGWSVTWTSAGAALLGLAILGCFAMGMALIFSAVNVFFRDAQNIVQTIAMFFHFMVPMMYPFTFVREATLDHPWVYQLYLANPLAESVLLLQKFFWQPLADDPSSLDKHFPPDLFERGFIMLGAGLVFLFVAQRIFARLEGKFPERL